MCYNSRDEQEEERYGERAAKPFRQSGPVCGPEGRYVGGRRAQRRERRREHRRGREAESGASAAPSAPSAHASARDGGAHGSWPAARSVRLQLPPVFGLRDLLARDPGGGGRTQARAAAHPPLAVGKGRRPLHQGREHRRPHDAVPSTRRRLHRRRARGAGEQALGQREGLPHRRAG